MNEYHTIRMEIPFSFVVGTGCLTVLLATALAYVLMEGKKRRQEGEKMTIDDANGEHNIATIVTSIDPIVYPGGVITVYYATQTGTAESFARELEREGVDHGFYVHVVDIEDVLHVSDLVKNRRTTTNDNKNEQSMTSTAIFLSATYGEGEAPDNATNFVNQIKQITGIEDLHHLTTQQESIEPSLKDLDFCVFGLGNKQYDHYNAMGKFLDTALEMLGASRITSLGLGNDDEDLEADFENWRENQLWPTLKKKYNVVPSSSMPSVLKKNTLPDCPYEVIYHEQKDSLMPNFDLLPEQIHSSSRHYFTAFDCPVTLVRELRNKDDPGSTIHVEIDISLARHLGTSPSTANNSPLTYTTADNLAVLPVNESSVVEHVAKRLGYDLDAIFSVQASPNHEWHGAPFPMPCTVRECLTRYCDLTSPPRRSDLKLLASYCVPDSVEQKALSRMASKEGRAEYKEKILDGYVGLVEILNLCPTIHMPLEHFLSYVSPIQARYYTISSSNLVHPKSVHLTVSVTQHERKNGSIFKGLCSSHLADFKKKETACRQTVRVFNRPSTFRLPKDSSRPIIMIGPGTGLAPMRALLQERWYQKTSLKMNVGANILYFGCKKESHDFIYKEELESFIQGGILDHLRVAFSREKAEKVYVQHLLKQHDDETWNYLEKEGAFLYICGGVKMGHDVCETLTEIISSKGKMSLDDGKAYLSRLSDQGRFVQELWA
jgi:NADPH-ferrihemoprotein reductase